MKTLALTLVTAVGLAFAANGTAEAGGYGGHGGYGGYNTGYGGGFNTGYGGGFNTGYGHTKHVHIQPTYQQKFHVHTPHVWQKPIYNQGCYTQSYNRYPSGGLYSQPGSWGYGY